ncbi:MAG TPA: hypothetical protein VL588_06995, partial [Bdellovibrionota bacterium]|nr:hypothetical protein [Bdellovibrionota bacterium]
MRSLFRQATHWGDHGLRVVRETSELIRGLRMVHDISPAVTVFGSARFNQGHPYYESAEHLGGLLARAG